MKMGLNQGLIYTNDSCIGCNRCIAECPVLGANHCVVENERNRIYVDDDKCLHCGKCLSVCSHGAREYRDDTLLFLEDLHRGEQISVIVAPSFFVEYGKRAEVILGYLREQGVKAFYDAGFGADIAAWAMTDMLRERDGDGAIAPTCSAVVNYAQKCAKTIRNKLLPLQEPFMCLAIYLRKYEHVHDKLAYLSPCVAAKDSMQDEVQYNVTFRHLMEALKSVTFTGQGAQVSFHESKVGSLFAVPGGLSAYVREALSDDSVIVHKSGTDSVYPYFDRMEQRIVTNREQPVMSECLNCKTGCFSGSGTQNFRAVDDDLFFKLEHSKSVDASMVVDELSLKPDDFVRQYDTSAYKERRHGQEIGSKDEVRLNEIFDAMYKTSYEDRHIDCQSCGYCSCKEMAIAIMEGYNCKENCIHYVKDENKRISMIDARCGIPNYHAFVEHTEELLAQKREQEFAFIYFNMSNFKFINQKYGFKLGDKALREYSISVNGIAQGEALIASVGSVNFAGYVVKEELDEVLSGLMDQKVYTLTELTTKEPVPIEAQIAVYLPNGTDTSAQMIFEKLTTTFSEIHRLGNSSILYYDEELQKKRQREEMLINAVMPALRDKEFQVFYQPKVDMRSRKIIGAEALIRWIRQDELIPPMEFIPACENAGLVQYLDFYVLESVCQHICEWLEKGIRVVPVSVNFSKQHFVEKDVADQIDAVVRKWNIPKEYIEIEFTETAYINESQNLIESIDKLHEYGIASSMDDFGTGYSSLSMLQNMSFDTLKLDKSFIDNRKMENERSRTVIQNIIHMAKDLNMSIVSEGIETESELVFMRDLDCDIAQGYLFDRPLNHDEFEKRLVRVYYK